MNKREYVKFWNVADDGKGNATIDICGELIDTRAWVKDVLARNYYTTEDFKNALESVADASHVTVNINSPGGDLFMGIAIYNALKALKGKVTTRVQGIAASAASIIFCAGEERIINTGGVLMIHGVSGYMEAFGYYNDRDIDNLIHDLKDMKKAFAVMNESIADIYHDTTGMTQADAKKLIADGAQLYMTADDAVERGFATTKDAGNGAKNYALRLVACEGKTQLFSGDHLLSRDFHAPENADSLGFVRESEDKISTAMNTDETKPATQANQQGHQPNADDIRKAERARISSIHAAAEKLGSRVSKELVDLAINGDDTHEPMSAEAFALAAVSAMNPETDGAAAAMQARAAELHGADGVAGGTATKPKNEFGLSDRVQALRENYKNTHPDTKNN